MAYITGWFKIIKDGQFVGTATDLDFARYSQWDHRLQICKAIDGQYVISNDKFYRDDWMLPLDAASYVEFEKAEVLSISEKEYDILNVAQGETVENKIVKIPGEEISEKKLSVSDEATIDFVRERKIRELSDICQKEIEKGVDLVLGDGVSHHFSMTANDQLNLAEMHMALVTRIGIAPYHADGELTQYYSDQDTAAIIGATAKWKHYNLAYFNALKNWINHMTSIEEIDAVSYESDIPSEYVTDVLERLSDNF